MTGTPEAAICDCTEPDRRVRALPLSSACAGALCGGCDGYTDGHSTYHCGHGCHWCPGGLHLRDRAGAAAVAEFAPGRASAQRKGGPQ